MRTVPLTIDAGGGLTAEALRRLVLDAGADDCGVVPLNAPGLEDERAHVLKAAPWARSLASYVVRMNRGPLRSPARSVANSEFHAAGRDVDGIGRAAARAFEDAGGRAIAPSMGFPMETDDWPGRMWVVAHKTVAVAAGMGAIGLHRCVIHPRYGSAVLLGTLVTDAEVKTGSSPLDFNPCFACRLCVAACPTGAIKPDGAFDFASCYTHNYREFMSGFTDWVETVADAGSARSYRRRVEDHETVSMWESLGYGPGYKAANCVAVCPAGEDLVGSFRANTKGFVSEVVRPFQDKKEKVYAVKGSDAHEHVAKRFPHKVVRTVGSGLRPVSAKGFVDFLPNLFQRGAAGGLDAVYHFTFTGSESFDATIEIRAGSLRIRDGLVGKPSLRVRADSSAWVGFVRGDRRLIGLLLSRRLRLRGDPRLLVRFGACFPT